MMGGNRAVARRIYLPAVAATLTTAALMLEGPTALAQPTAVPVVQQQATQQVTQRTQSSATTRRVQEPVDISGTRILLQAPGQSDIPAHCIAQTRLPDNPTMEQLNLQFATTITVNAAGGGGGPVNLVGDFYPLGYRVSTDSTRNPPFILLRYHMDGNDQVEHTISLPFPSSGAQVEPYSCPTCAPETQIPSHLAYLTRLHFELPVPAGTHTYIFYRSNGAFINLHAEREVPVEQVAPTNVVSNRLQLQLPQPRIPTPGPATSPFSRFSFVAESRYVSGSGSRSPMTLTEVNGTLAFPLNPSVALTAAILGGVDTTGLTLSQQLASVTVPWISGAIGARFRLGERSSVYGAGILGVGVALLSEKLDDGFRGSDREFRVIYGAQAGLRTRHFILDARITTDPIEPIWVRAGVPIPLSPVSNVPSVIGASASVLTQPIPGHNYTTVSIGDPTAPREVFVGVFVSVPFSRSLSVTAGGGPTTSGAVSGNVDISVRTPGL